MLLVVAKRTWWTSCFCRVTLARKKEMKEGKTINVSAALISGRDKGLILRCVLRSSVCLSPSLSVSVCLSVCLPACLSLSILRFSGCVCLCLLVWLFVFVCLCLFLNQNESLISRRTQHRINFLSQPELENRAGNISFSGVVLKGTNPVEHDVISVWLSVRGPSVCPSIRPSIWISVHLSERLSLSLSSSVCLHLRPNERDSFKRPFHYKVCSFVNQY